MSIIFSLLLSIILSTISFASFDISITFSTKYKKTSKHEKANKLYYRLILLEQIVAHNLKDTLPYHIYLIVY